MCNLISWIRCAFRIKNRKTTVALAASLTLSLLSLFTVGFVDNNTGSIGKDAMIFSRFTGDIKSGDNVIYRIEGTSDYAAVNIKKIDDDGYAYIYGGQKIYTSKIKGKIYFYIPKVKAAVNFVKDIVSK